MNSTFKFTADTINGVIQQHPQQFHLRCSKVKPIGLSIVRTFNGNECIQAMKVFLILYDGKLMGNKCYTTYDEFMQALKNTCFTDYIMINGCNLQLDGCDLILN